MAMKQLQRQKNKVSEYALQQIWKKLTMFLGYWPDPSRFPLCPVTRDPKFVAYDRNRSECSG